MICSERMTLLPLEPGAAPARDTRYPRRVPLVGPPGPELSADEPEATRFAMLDGEELARMIHYGEEDTPESRHATIDLFVDPARRIAIDPALANEAAILAYEKASFRRVGVIEAYWLDHVTGDWSDGLLMERVIRG